MLKFLAKTTAVATIATTALLAAGTTPAKAQAEPFIGQMMIVGFNFCPRGWANADGSLLPIAQHTALFSLLGTIYGGDGRTTFGLPDLRGRVIVSDGQGPGLSNYQIGSRRGSETNTLTVQQLPPHAHSASSSATTIVDVLGTSANGNSNNPSNALPAVDGFDFVYNNSASADNPMSSAMATATTDVTTTVGSTGSGVSVNNIQPTLTMNVCIALVGVYPSRS